MLRQVVRRSNPLRMQVRGSAWNFQELMESRIPDYKGRPNRSGAELEQVKAALPKIEFMTSYEFDVLTKTRSNLTKEYSYQRDMRLKVTELMLDEAPHELEGLAVEGDAALKQLAELKALQTLTEYAGDLLEGQNQIVQRVNDFVDSNPVYLLDQPLREEARWNLLPEMDHKTRSLVRTELRDWLPAEYRQTRAVDLQQVAAFSPPVKADMFRAIEARAKDAEAEIRSLPPAEQAGLLALVKDNVAKSKAFIDPTYDITPEAINACNDVDALRAMAHRVTEYSGDARLLAIYGKAAQLTGDTAAQAILKEAKDLVF
uniref:COXEG7 n=1 Tax=Euglena gracilis TaxID=3039 RepID=UPI002FE4FAEB